MIGQILIGKNTAYLAKRGGGTVASAKEINDLAEGAFGVITEDGTLVTVAGVAAAFLDQKYFYVYVGGATAALTMASKKVVRTNVVMNYLAYAAPVDALAYLGDDNTDTYDLNFPAALLTGDIATVTLVDDSNDTIPQKAIKRYDYRVRSGDTETSVITGLVALVNADPEIATATAIDAGTANQGIRFNAVAGVSLKVLASGILSDAPVTGKVAQNPGVGTPAAIAELESYYSVYKGNTSRLNLNGLLYTETSRVVATDTYDMFNLNYEYTHNGTINSQSATKQTLTIAIPNGAACIASLTTIFGTAFNPGTTAGIESGAAETDES